MGCFGFVCVFSTEWQAGIPKFSVSNLHLNRGLLEAVFEGVKTEIMALASEFEELDAVLIGVMSGAVLLLAVRTGKVSVGSYDREHASEVNWEIWKRQVGRQRERRAQGRKEMSEESLGVCREKREDRQGQRACA
jgi:hypothetical protein